MIKNQDRSKWFGASDTSTIMGNWETQTFLSFWGEKSGIPFKRYKTWAMDVGNIMEHPIIDKISEITHRRIRKGRFPSYRPHRLRVNYDGITPQVLIEVKTSINGFKTVPLNYWMQCQVLMFAKHRKKCELWLYLLTEDDYREPYFPVIDSDRLVKFGIAYDAEWIKTKYLPKLKYLSKCLRRGIYPRTEDLIWQSEK